MAETHNEIETGKGRYTEHGMTALPIAWQLPRRNDTAPLNEMSMGDYTAAVGWGLRLCLQLYRAAFGLGELVKLILPGIAAVISAPEPEEPPAVQHA